MDRSQANVGYASQLRISLLIFIRNGASLVKTAQMLYDKCSTNKEDHHAAPGNKRDL